MGAAGIRLIMESKRGHFREIPDDHIEHVQRLYGGGDRSGALCLTRPGGRASRASSNTGI